MSADSSKKDELTDKDAEQVTGGTNVNSMNLTVSTTPTHPSGPIAIPYPNTSTR